MARSFLTKARLPKRFWYWAVREANLWHKILPMTSNPATLQDLKFWMTLYKEFYREQPDYRILFKFGSIGAFPQVTDGSTKRLKMDAQAMLGIAVEQSEFTTGMVFYNPEMDSFCVSADYILDKQKQLSDVFPLICYDEGGHLPIPIK